MKWIFSLLIISIKTTAQTPELIFNSGFEPSTSIATVTATTSDLLGTDNTLTSRNNWKTHLDAHTNIGYSVLQFDDASNASRGANLIADPTNVQNQVIQFWSKTPNLAGTYSRVQACVYDNNNLSNVFTSVRMYLPADINLLKQMTGTFDWFTIMEFWNSPNWNGSAYPFRVSLNIRKLNANSGTLNIRAYGQKYDTATSSWAYIWDNTNTSIAIPSEKWFTLETHILEGDASNGKFRLTMTPDGESAQTLFDITNYTHHPDEITHNGIDSINPFKLYTAANLTNYLTNNNGMLNVLYDDFKIWKNVPFNTLKHVGFDQKSETSFLYWNASDQTIRYKNRNDSENLSMNFTIFDLNGKLVYKQENTKPKDFLVTKDQLSAGAYLYQIKINETVEKGKILIP